MSFVIICGPQAVGKMTVGRALEAADCGTLLYNHQTIDLFAQFLGYNPVSFTLSEETRFRLFRAFAENPETNVTKNLLFTVLLDFNSGDDWQFLQEACSIFLAKGEQVYCLELTAQVQERLVRNVQADRLAAKPSKRDLAASRKDLLDSMENYRLNSRQGEFTEKLPAVAHLLVDNTQLTPQDVVQRVLTTWPELSGQ